MSNTSANPYDDTAARRADAANRYRAIANLLDKPLPLAEVEPYIDSAIKAATDTYRRLVSDQYGTDFRRIVGAA